MDDQFRQNYEQRIHRVMDYINTHLDEEISLEILAALAAFSPYHFHRVFTALTGEPVAAHVRRLRLERAARCLIAYPRQSITEVAFGCGFTSQAVFARAFRERFGQSASQWRLAGSKECKAKGKKAQTNGKGGEELAEASRYALPRWVPQRHLNEEEKSVEVVIEEMPAIRAAYIRRIGPYAEASCQAWEALSRWAGPRNLFGPGHICFSLSYDDPAVTPPEKLRYDACIEVDAETPIEEPAGEVRLPARRVAKARYCGPARGIADAYTELYSRWLPASGFVPADAPPMDIYYSELGSDPEHDHFVMDICLSVVPA
jgi:AraC family transcriptional regulator